MSIGIGNTVIAGRLEGTPHYVGEIFTAPYEGWTPPGAVLANGAEFTAEQFPTLYSEYIQTKKLITCTYDEFAEDVIKTGSCAKFGVDITKKAFRVPNISDGTFIESGNGTSHAAGLPNITGESGWASDVAADYLPSGCYTQGKNQNRLKWSGGGDAKTLQFDASLSNSIYGNSTTVQPKSVSTRFFVQLAHGTINQSMMDWSKFMQSIELIRQSTANKDLSNVSQIAKEVIQTTADYTPNLAAGVSFETDIHFPQRGWLFINSPKVTRGDTWVKLDEVIVYQKLDYDFQNGYHQTSDTTWIPYSANQFITSAGNFTTRLFYPIKGVK